MESQLGNGSTLDSAAPVTVLGVADAVDVSAAAAHTCAVLADGSVRCWGKNTNGQLGDGTITSRSTPVAVSGLVGAVEVAAGGATSCARLFSGAVRCWGQNYGGTLGNGTYVNNSVVPVDVVGITDAGELDVGTAHACARLTAGTLQCWGDNRFGGVGDGTSTTNHYVPVAVLGITDAAQISVGGFSSCARSVGGALRCWGGNFDGQLATGTRASFPSPTVPMRAPL